MKLFVSKTNHYLFPCIIMLLALGGCRSAAAPAATTPAAAPAVDTAALETELTALNDRLVAAYEANDVATLETMLAPEHTHNNVFGMRMDKDTFLQDIRSGILVFERYDTTEIEWHIYQDVAIATGTIEAIAYRGGNKVPSSRFRFTRIFERKGDTWQVLLFHNTILSGPPTPAPAPAQ